MAAATVPTEPLGTPRPEESPPSASMRLSISEQMMLAGLQKAGEMALLLRAFAAVAKNSSSVPHTHVTGTGDPKKDLIQAVKNKDFLKFAGKWMEIENTILSEGCPGHE